MGLYVYAVASSDAGEAPPLQGILDRPTFRVDAGPVSAFVSECPLKTLWAERKHIAAAHRVLSALSAKFDLLPMAFGTITKSESDLRQFLDGRRDLLTEQLQRVSGAVEMGVRLSFETDDPLTYLVARTPELQDARNRTFSGRRPPSHEAKLRLGQLVDETLRRYRETHTQRVMSMLDASCIELISLPVRGEREIANIAALVLRASVDDFEAAVHASAKQLDEDVAFNIAGPWPPHNFVQLEPRKE